MLNKNTNFSYGKTILVCGICSSETFKLFQPSVGYTPLEKVSHILYLISNQYYF